MPQLFLSPQTLLTPPQRKLLWIAAAAVAATRLFAMATSPWDWDEVQFMAGVREYDVVRHHPHPAGFPLYILLGNLVQLFGLSDFRSLQVIAFLAACSLFPLMFFLARELRFSFRTSFLAALFFAFFPNVWYFGGTIFSDVTGTAFVLAAAGMLLRGCRDGRSFLIGCALVGAALAVRPHSGFILLPPLLVATWCQRKAWGRIAAGAAIAAIIIIGSYAGAALASQSAGAYVESVRFFQRWVHEADSIANPNRGSLRDLAVDFLVWPMGAGRLSMAVTGLSIAGLVIGAMRRHAGVWVTFATFAPYMIFAWLMLDPVGFRRYSTAYVAIYALLAVYALEQLTLRFGAIPQAMAVAAVMARYVMWVYPAIAEVRSTIAPTHAASTFARAVGDRIWIDDSMKPWAGYYLADRQVKLVENPGQLPMTGATMQDWFLDEGMMNEDGAHVFARPRGRVAEIHPRRHFEASVAPLPIVWRFGAGWSDHEGHLASNWRWMAGRSVTLIPGQPGRARLRLVLGPPKGLTPDVEVRVNGAAVDRFTLSGRVEKEWIIDDSREVNRLELTTSATINPRGTGQGSDDRDLGLRLLGYGWRPLP